MKTLISQIVANKTTCYFISPHLDDAILSAGGLISYLCTKTTVKLITIFTEASEKPYTMAAKGYLRHCGYSNAAELFKTRQGEDRNVGKALSINPVHLGFIDGTFRKRNAATSFIQQVGKYIPELTHLYPLGFKTISLARQDKQLKKEIGEKLKNVINEKENYIVFCPLGTVKHMDHEITRDVCLQIFKYSVFAPLLAGADEGARLLDKGKRAGRGGKASEFNQNLIFWQDFPYIKDPKSVHNFMQKHTLQKFTWDKNLEEKKELVKKYKTQLKSLFSDDKIPHTPEVFYFNEIGQ